VGGDMGQVGLKFGGRAWAVSQAGTRKVMVETQTLRPILYKKKVKTIFTTKVFFTTKTVFFHIIQKIKTLF
jgi:hypothetical protein